MIIFGSRNYNKRNYDYHRGVCENCGRSGFLKSYDTTKFVHLYWLPVIPHGSKHVIDQCPHCKAGKEMSLSDWKKARATQLQPVLQALRSNPGDRELTEQALALATSFGTKEEFVKVVSMAGKHHTNDPEILAKMGWSLNHFNMLAESRQAIEASLRLKEDPELRQFLDFLESQQELRTPKPPARILSIIPMLILPGIVAFMAFPAILAGASGKPRYVYALNGLEEPYDVLVNGQPVSLVPQKPRRLDVEFGSITVEPASEKLDFEPIDVELEGSISNKIGGGPTVVFNPDQIGVVVWEKAVYAEEVSDISENEGSLRIHAGQPLYQFSDLDMRFSEFPEEVSMSESQSRAYREGIYLLEAESLQDSLFILATGGFEKEAAKLAAAAMRQYPEDDYVTSLALDSLSTEKTLERLREFLDEKPALISLHRRYQELVRAAHPEHDLVAEYEERVKKAPGDAGLLYLLGRVQENPADAVKTWKMALEKDPKASWAAYALAFHELNAGQHAEALKHITTAVSVQPDNGEFLDLELEILLANGDLKGFAAKRQASFDENPQDHGAAIDLACIYGALNDSQSLEAIVKDYTAALEEYLQSDEAVLEEIRAMLQASAASGKHDPAAFVSAATAANHPEFSFQAAIATHDSAALEELDLTELSVYDTFLVYAALKAEGKNPAAKSTLEDALAILKESGDFRSEELAEWFESGTPPQEAEVVDLTLSPGSLREVAVALAYHYPAKREAYLKLAREWNFDPRMPCLAVETLAQAPAAAKPAPAVPSPASVTVPAPIPVP